jgi:mannitol/fructose-specific phosphotransferase system IIA component (Ntr-type)
MNHWKQFKPKACSVHLKAHSKEEALAEVVRNLVEAEVLPEARAGDAEQALLERERTASTGVGMSVAIPHVKLLAANTSCSRSTGRALPGTPSTARCSSSSP